VENIYPATATIRTLDIGGDKFLPDYSKNNELNPALGLRAIRFSLKETDIFKTQLRGDSKSERSRKTKDPFPDDFGDRGDTTGESDLGRGEKGLAKAKISLMKKSRSGP